MLLTEFVDLHIYGPIVQSSYSITSNGSYIIIEIRISGKRVVKELPLVGEFLKGRL